MNFLLTNDDGIDAPGIDSLQKSLQRVMQGKIPGESHQIQLIAPQGQLSGCGHQVTTQEPIQVEQRSESEFAVAGTPVDCVRLGLWQLSGPVDWVLSGINFGGNLGADIYISGTVAAVREAALHRVPAIAISHYRNGLQPIDWDLAACWSEQVLTDLLAQPVKPGSFWNVNLPHLPPGSADPEIVFCPLCTQPLPVDYQREGDRFRYCGRYADRQRDLSADVDVCLSGRIAVTLINLC